MSKEAVRSALLTEFGATERLRRSIAGYPVTIFGVNAICSLVRETRSGRKPLECKLWVEGNKLARDQGHYGTAKGGGHAVEFSLCLQSISELIMFSFPSM
jgi:hypothetical protein